MKKWKKFWPVILFNRLEDNNSSFSYSSTSSNTSSEVNPANVRQIINNVSNEWESKYTDTNITNEWLSDQYEDDRYIVLFGSLKNDPRQGVTEVLHTNRECSQVKDEKRFLTPSKHGSIKVYMLGAKDTTMVVVVVVDADGNEWNFQIFNGFNLLNINI
jgi:hypothetical protein